MNSHIFYINLVRGGKTLMKKILVIIIISLVCFTSLASATAKIKNVKENLNEQTLEKTSKDIIVFIANQGWFSRIYILNMDGQIVNYFEYEYYIFCDVEVVDNELYVTDWVAPRLYKVDLSTGNLDIIVDDWNLLYMYDVAFDGAFFYIDEWDLNRYDINGNYQGTSSFNQDIRGSAWDGSYYWTLNLDNQIKCWDIGSWPTITEISENMFNPPTTSCRGLWFDGEYFWTAESIDGSLGHIYQFNYNGDIISQWQAPAYMGYSACLIKDFLPNNNPDKPDIHGPLIGIAGEEYSWTFCSIDPDGDDLYYFIDWGDGNNTDWIGPYFSDRSIEINHTYYRDGNYTIKAKVKDIYDAESEWAYLEVKMPVNQPAQSYGFPLLQKILDMFPNAFPFLRQILKI